MTHSSVGYCVKVRTRSKSGLMNSTFGRLQSGGTLANQMQETTLGSHWIRCTNLNSISTVQECKQTLSICIDEGRHTLM